jgi:hypothetical protein
MLAAGRLDEEERDVLGADPPRGKGGGDALREARNRVAAEDRNLRELLPPAARSGGLHKDALRRRAGGRSSSCGGGGGVGRERWRGGRSGGRRAGAGVTGSGSGGGGGGGHGGSENGASRRAVCFARR